MYYLLSSSPVFKEGQFDLTAIYTAEDLTDFIQACQKLRTYIEGQFLHPIREDIEKKPTAQLHWFLKMVGITTLNQSKKVKNRKVYQYMIDPESYNSMISLVELRDAVKDDWSVVNALNGFKNEPNFEN